MAPAGVSVGNVEGAIYVEDTHILSKVADILGISDDARYYNREFERVKAAYNNAYYNINEKSYVPATQANISMPLIFGIVPQADEGYVTQSLLNIIAKPKQYESASSYGIAGEFGQVLPDHISTGDIGTTFLWRALGNSDQARLVQTMIMQKTAPSYLNMINEGCTTIPENWNYSKTRSHNHDMYAGIMEWLFRSLGGISALKPGYEEILLKPSFPVGLDSVSVATQTVRGLISSSWKVKNGVTKWHVEIPVNTTAQLYIALPVNSNGIIREGNKTIWENGNGKSSDSISFSRIVTDPYSGLKFLVFTAGSGAYNLQW